MDKEMDKEETIEKIKIMQRFANGEILEFEGFNTDWLQVDNPDWNWSHYDYRIKPNTEEGMEHHEDGTDYAPIPNSTTEQHTQVITAWQKDKVNGKVKIYKEQLIKEESELFHELRLLKSQQRDIIARIEIIEKEIYGNKNDEQYRGKG